MRISLTPEIEHALIEEARKLGTTPEMLALESLRERFLSSRSVERSGEEVGTLADFLGGHIGVLHSGEQIPGGARMSQGSGGKFAAALLRQRQQGC